MHGSLLLQTILDALTLNRNRPMQLAWTRFVVSAVREFEGDFRPLLFPIVDTMCEVLQKAVGGTGQQIDCLELLSAIETISLQGMDGGAMESGGKTPRTTTEPVGLFGYVTGVLHGDTAQTEPRAQEQSRSDGSECVAVVCRAMQQVTLSRQMYADDKVANAAMRVLRRHQETEPRVVLDALIDEMIPGMLDDQACRAFRESLELADHKPFRPY